jgi:hypothetical protein
VKIDIPKVMTTIECANKSCNSKTLREFQRGDYVFKETDVACGKCGGKQMVTAIYKEVKEKDKTYRCLSVRLKLHIHPLLLVKYAQLEQQVFCSLPQKLGSP